jgi:hypothetical protein
LAEELLASLDTGEVEVEAAWDAEIRKRVAEVESGTVQLVPGEEAFAQVRQALRRRSPLHFIRKRLRNWRIKLSSTRNAAKGWVNGLSRG